MNKVRYKGYTLKTEIISMKSKTICKVIVNTDFCTDIFIVMVSLPKKVINDYYKNDLEKAKDNLLNKTIEKAKEKIDNCYNKFRYEIANESGQLKEI